MFRTDNPVQIVNKLKSYRSVKIFVSDRPASICTANILMALLHKEFVKFEVSLPSEDEEYGSDVDFYVFVNLDPKNCRNFLVIGSRQASSLESDVFVCSCGTDEIHSCVLSYSLAKSMNYINNDILWSMIVCFDFYRIFAREDGGPAEDDKENENSGESEEERVLSSICSGCRELYLDLIFEVQKENNSSEVDGVYYGRRPRISFLNSMDLFSALQNDVSFILEKRLYRRRSRRTEEQRICEHLAGKGISQRSSREMYMNLSYHIKRLIQCQFRQATNFYRRIGHCTEISPVENFFLICIHLLGVPRTNSLLCLSGKGVMEMDRCVRFYKKFISVYRDCIAGHRRLGKTVVFRIRASDFPKDMSVGLLLHLYSYHVRVFTRGKYGAAYSQVIVLEEHLEGMVVVSSDDLGVMAELGRVGKALNGCVAVAKNEFCKLIEDKK